MPLPSIALAWGCKGEAKQSQEDAQIAAWKKAQNEASQAVDSQSEAGAAKTPPPPPPRPGSPPKPGNAAPPNEGATDVSPEQLDRFAEALKEVRDVRQDLAQEIAGKQDQQKARELQLQASNDVQKELDKLDMTVPEYERMAEQVSASPQLQAKVEARIAIATLD